MRLSGIASIGAAESRSVVGEQPSGDLTRRHKAASSPECRPAAPGPARCKFAIAKRPPGRMGITSRLDDERRCEDEQESSFGRSRVPTGVGKQALQSSMRCAGLAAGAKAEGGASDGKVGGLVKVGWRVAPRASARQLERVQSEAAEARTSSRKSEERAAGNPQRLVGRDSQYRRTTRGEELSKNCYPCDG